MNFDTHLASNGNLRRSWGMCNSLKEGTEMPLSRGGRGAGFDDWRDHHTQEVWGRFVSSRWRGVKPLRELAASASSVLWYTGQYQSGDWGPSRNVPSCKNP